MADIAGGSVVWNLDVDDSKFTAGLAKAKVQTKSFASGLDRVKFAAFANNASTAFGNIATGISRAAVRLGAFGAIASGVFLKSAADLQQTSKSYEVLTGNQEVANKLFAQLARYAATTPFEFPQIAKAGQTLLGFGIASKDVFARVQTLGDIAAATGADFNSLAVVYGQVNAAGRLMGQDSLQLINNNIPITSILAKRLGITVAEVKEQMEKGAISADDFNSALLGVTKKGGFAFQGTDILAQSLNGRLSTLKDTVLEFGRSLLGVRVDPKLGLVIEPGGVFDRFSKLVPRITARLEELGPSIKGFVDLLVRNGDTVVAIIYGIAAAFVAAKVAAIGLRIAAMAAEGTLKMNAIAVGIVLVIALVTFLQKRFDFIGKTVRGLTTAWDFVVRKVREFARAVSEAASGAITWIKDRVNDVKLAFFATRDAVVDFYNVVKDKIEDIIQWFKDHKEGLEQIATVLTVVLGPAFLKVAAQATASAAQAAGAWIAAHARMVGSSAVANAHMIAHAVSSGVAWTVQAVKAAVAWIVNLPRVIASAAVTSGQMIVHAVAAGYAWIVQGIRAAAQWVATFTLMIARAIATAVIFVAQAAIGGYAWILQGIAVAARWLIAFAIMSAGAIATGLTMAAAAIAAGIAWLIAMGPVLLIIAAVAIAAFLVIRYWSKIKAFFSGLWNSVSNFASSAATRVVSMFRTAVDRVKTAFGGVLNFVRELPGKIVSVLGNLGRTLFNAGKSLIQGLLDGAGSLLSKIGSFFLDKVPGFIREPFKKALGISSPSKVFAGYGRNITEGLVKGITAGQNQVEGAIGTLTGGVTGPTLDMGGYSGAQGMRQTVVKADFSGIVARSRSEWRDIVKDGLEAVNEELRARQLPELGNGALAGGLTNG